MRGVAVDQADLTESAFVGNRPLLHGVRVVELSACGGEMFMLFIIVCAPGAEDLRQTCRRSASR